MSDFDYSDDFLEHIADLFGAFSHLTRLKILRELHREGETATGHEKGELSVGTLQERIGTSQANISKHLQLMKDEGLLDSRKQGPRKYFYIASTEVMMICDYVCGYMEDRLRSLSDLGSKSLSREEVEG